MWLATYRNPTAHFASATLATSTKPKPEPVLSLAGLREILQPEPLMSARLTVRISRREHEQLQRVATAAGVTTSHAVRRLVALAAETLLAEQGQEA